MIKMVDIDLAVRHCTGDVRKQRWDAATIATFAKQALTYLVDREPEAAMDQDGVIADIASTVSEGAELDLDARYTSWLVDRVAYICFQSDAGDKRDAERAAALRASTEAWLQPRG